MPHPHPVAQPVTWRALLLTVLAAWLVCTALACFAAWWAWGHLLARVSLQDQTAQVLLPPQLAVKASVGEQVRVRLDHDLAVTVPVHQRISVPLDQAIELDVELDTTVPIDLEVPVEHLLRIDQTIELDTQVRTKILGFSVTIPIQGEVPLKADVPIRLTIPVRQRLPVHLKAPATVRVQGPLSVQIDADIRTTVPLHETLSLPVTAPVQATLFFSQREVTAGLRLMDIALPLDAITLARREPLLIPSAAVPAREAASRAAKSP